MGNWLKPRRDYGWLSDNYWAEFGLFIGIFVALPLGMALFIFLCEMIR